MRYVGRVCMGALRKRTVTWLSGVPWRYRYADADHDTVSALPTRQTKIFNMASHLDHIFLMVGGREEVNS